MLTKLTQLSAMTFAFAFASSALAKLPAEDRIDRRVKLQAAADAAESKRMALIETNRAKALSAVNKKYDDAKKATETVYDKAKKLRTSNSEADKVRVSNFNEADKRVKKAEQASGVKNKCKELGDANDYLKSVRTPASAPFDYQAPGLIKRLKAVADVIKKETSFSCPQINAIASVLESGNVSSNEGDELPQEPALD